MDAVPRYDILHTRACVRSLSPRSQALFPTDGEGARGSRQDCRLRGPLRELGVRIGMQEH